MHLRDAIVASILALTHPTVPRSDAERRADEYAPMFLREYPEDPFLAVAVAAHESAGFRPWKLGPAGEIGVMQINPRAYPEVDPVLLHDGATNIRLGCARLRKVAEKCKGGPARWLGRYPGRKCGPTKYADRVLRLLSKVARFRAVAS